MIEITTNKDLIEGKRVFLADHIEPSTPQALTRDQAIKRIIDILGKIEVDHLCASNYHDDPYHSGAIKELMAIFDIKEEDLK